MFWLQKISYSFYNMYVTKIKEKMEKTDDKKPNQV